MKNNHINLKNEKRTRIFFALILVSCGEDNKNDPPVVVTYGITIEKTCKGTSTTYCVSKTTYDRINVGVIIGDPVNMFLLRIVTM